MADWKELRELAVKQKFGPKTPGQEIYWRALQAATVVLCSGPAGSGKTLLATAHAITGLLDGRYKKVIFTRPLVSCGKGVGYLPGDLLEKVSPYVRPLLDASMEFMSVTELNKRLADESIEIWPLDLMRGLSLKETCLICDEAQNAEYEQLHMLLTRFGQGSKVIVTGDTTQSDLEGNNAFRVVMGALGGNRDISRVYLTEKDILRHPLIKFIDKRLSEKKNFLLSPSDEFWYNISCHACKNKLWYDNGDENDPDTEDVAQVVCWSCGAFLDILDETTCKLTQKMRKPQAESYPIKP